MATDKKFLTITEAADLLKVSKTSLRRWTNQGRLKCYRLGERKERRFLIDDLLAYAPSTDLSSATEQIITTTEHKQEVLASNYSHCCSLYRNKNEHWQMLQSHLLQHLEQNTVTVYLYDGDVSRIEAWLTKAGYNVPALQAQGILRLIPADSMYLAEGNFQVERTLNFWKDIIGNCETMGTKRLFITGEMNWASKDAPGSEHLIDYESALDSIVSEYNWITILCQYDLNAFSATTIVDTLSMHTSVKLKNSTSSGLITL